MSLHTVALDLELSTVGSDCVVSWALTSVCISQPSSLLQELCLFPLPTQRQNHGGPRGRTAMGHLAL
jgi:hypothetical protein